MSREVCVCLSYAKAPRCALFGHLIGRYTCEGGAVYKVTTIGSLSHDSGQVNCNVCGRIMDQWRYSRSFRRYDLITQYQDLMPLPQRRDRIRFAAQVSRPRLGGRQHRRVFL